MGRRPNRRWEWQVVGMRGLRREEVAEAGEQQRLPQKQKQKSKSESKKWIPQCCRMKVSATSNEPVSVLQVVRRNVGSLARSLARVEFTLGLQLEKPAEGTLRQRKMGAAWCLPLSNSCPPFPARPGSLESRGRMSKRQTGVVGVVVPRRDHGPARDAVPSRHKMQPGCPPKGPGIQPASR